MKWVLNFIHFGVKESFILGKHAETGHRNLLLIYFTSSVPVTLRSGFQLLLSCLASRRTVSNVADPLHQRSDAIGPRSRPLLHHHQRRLASSGVSREPPPAQQRCPRPLVTQPIAGRRACPGVCCRLVQAGTGGWGEGERGSGREGTNVRKEGG